MSFLVLGTWIRKKQHKIQWCHAYLGCVFGGLVGVSCICVFASLPEEKRMFVTMCDVSLHIQG